MTDVGGAQGIRGRRKSTYVSGAIVLFIVAFVLAITSFVTGAGLILWVAVAVAVLAAILLLIGRRVRHEPPSHEDHPRLPHDEHHPKDTP